MAVGPPGQFYHGVEYEVTDLRPGEVPEKPDATMFVKGQELNVTRYTSNGSEMALVNNCAIFEWLLVEISFLVLSTEAGRETSGGT